MVSSLYSQTNWPTHAYLSLRNYIVRYMLVQLFTPHHHYRHRKQRPPLQGHIHTMASGLVSNSATRTLSTAHLDMDSNENTGQWRRYGGLGARPLPKIWGVVTILWSTIVYFVSSSIEISPAPCKYNIIPLDSRYENVLPTICIVKDPSSMEKN